MNLLGMDPVAQAPTTAHCAKVHMTTRPSLLRLARTTISLCLLLLAALPAAPQPSPGAPVFEVTPVESWIKFHVKSSVTLAGKFDNWDAKLTFSSPDETTGVLTINIQAASVDTGSGTKN